MKPSTVATADFEVVKRIICNRRTEKVMATGEELPVDSDPRLSDCDELLDECVATAGWAPFHYDRQCDGIPEPWRVHTLRRRACQQLARELPELESLKPSSKLPRLLSGCHALVLVNWIPQEVPPEAPPTALPETGEKSQASGQQPVEGSKVEYREKTGGEPEIDPKKRQRVNEEHLAAASATAQNLLLLAESLGWHSYWSSGGVLDGGRVGERIGIPPAEKLIAAVFIRYHLEPESQLDIVSGKLRGRRSSVDRWSRVITQLD